MARRVSTEYIKILLMFKSERMEQFVQFFKNENLNTEVKLCENGDQEITISNNGDQICFSFINKKGSFEFDGSHQIYDIHLAGIMRKALKEFNGYAIVKRIYQGFTMVYYYENGIVVKIVEKSNNNQERIIYKYTNFNWQLEWIFRNCEAEKEIDRIKSQINSLLDQRNVNYDPREIDQRLEKLSHQLFILEA